MTGQEKNTTGRILLVDDEAGILSALKAILTVEGYDITTARNGREAWDVLMSSPFDLIITDIRHYPVNGLEFIRMVRDRGLTVPVIIITAFATLKSADEACRLGVFAFISKPFNVANLCKQIALALAAGNTHRDPKPGDCE